MRLDGDGQHDPAELPELLAALDAGRRGRRHRIALRRRRRHSYRPPLARRIGIVWFAQLVSLLTRQRVTDTTSGFQALNRRGIALFARDYPSDYPEVEATLLVLRSRLRLVEVPVRDARARARVVVDHVHLAPIYYVFKVTLALLVAMGRRATFPTEERTPA